jgi:hypothetical protein
MAALISNCTVVGEQAMNLCFVLFSEDVKNLKFIGEANDLQKVHRFAL